MLVRNYFQPWQFHLLLPLDVFNFQWLFPTKKQIVVLLRNILRALCFPWVISTNHCWWKGSARIAAWSPCFPHLEIHLAVERMKPNQFVFVSWFVSIVKWKRKWNWCHPTFFIPKGTTSLSAEYKVACVLRWGMQCL